MDYRLLGPIEVQGETGPVDLGAPKQRAVLAVLLLAAGQVVAADRIVQAVWGDVPPPSVSASLQAYVSNLRRLLRGRDDSSPIERRSPGYRLVLGGDEVDTDVFLRRSAQARDAVDNGDWATAVETARGALALWRGPALGELHDEPWAQLDVRTLEERRDATSEALVTALLGSDRTAEAVDVARRLHDADPLRERSTWLLLLALHRAGRTPEALDAFRAHARLLDEELGLSPAPALQDLHTAILRQDPEVASWPNAPQREQAEPEPQAAQIPAVAAPPAPPAEDFVGRARELDAIAGLLGGSRDGTRWLVLTGPAGIGKTRLAEETVRGLQARGARVLRAVCPEDEGTPAWWPVRQILRALDVDADATLTMPPGTQADAGRYVLYDRLTSLLAAAASAQPVVAFIDDVQWSDPTSLRWLTHVAETVPDLPLVLVLTVRDQVPSVDLERLLAAVARRRGAAQLAVAPLSADEVGRLASIVSGEPVEPSEVQALADQTGGNPFFVGEYARLPREERATGGIPVAVRSVLRRRLSAVDTEVLQVLRTAAVAGDPMDVELLCAVTRQDRDELADLLDEAAEHDLIVPTADGATYRFTHGLLRDEVLAGLSAPRRQRLHLKIAEAYGDAEDPERTPRRAAHLLAALPLADPHVVFEACRKAAQAAEDRWFSDDAAGWWAAASRAYAMLPAADQDDEERDELLIARVNALGRAGRRQTVITVVEAALSEAVHADRIASAGRLAAASLRTGGVWPWTSFSVDPGPLLTRLAGVEPLVRTDPGAHARVLAALAVGSYYDADPTVPDRLSDRALRIAEQLGDDDVLADALWARALAFSGLPSRAAETVELLDRLVALPHRLARIDAVLRHTMLTLSLFTLGDIRGVEEHLREGIAASDALRLPVARVQLRWMEGTLALWHGDLDRGSRLADRAGELHRQTEMYLMNVDGFARVARAWEDGDIDRLADLTFEENPAMPYLHAADLLARNRTEEAAAMIASAASRRQPEIWTTLGEIVLAGHLVADRGLTDAAVPMLRALEPHRGRVGLFGQTGQFGPADLAIARLHHLLGDRAAAEQALASARRIAEAGGGRGVLLRCRLLGLQLGGTSDDPLALADEADALGLRRVAEEARALAAEPAPAGPA